MADNDSKGLWIVAGVAGAAVIGLWVVTWIFVPEWYPGAGERGQFGDMFGSVNALFSGLAFVGVVVAILLQRQELIAQREELRLTRTEVHRQADQLELQAKTMQAQQFEATFFQLLGLLHEIIASYEDIGQFHHRGSMGLRDTMNRSHTESGDHLTIENEFPIRPYFKILTEILEYIARHREFDYVSILRAQLSDAELLLIFVYCKQRARYEPKDTLLWLVNNLQLFYGWMPPDSLQTDADQLLPDAFKVPDHGRLHRIYGDLKVR